MYESILLFYKSYKSLTDIINGLIRKLICFSTGPALFGP